MFEFKTAAKLLQIEHNTKFSPYFFTFHFFMIFLAD